MLWAQSRKAFKHHTISSRGDGRWVLQRTIDNAGWTWNMGAEIVGLGHQALVVGGDNDVVVFKGGNLGDHQSRVFWMGGCTDIDYIAEKARIGMSDGGRICEVYDVCVAQSDMASMIEDHLRHDAKDSNVDIELAELLRHPRFTHVTPHHDAHVCALVEAHHSHCDEGPDRLTHFLYDYPDTCFEAEDLFNLGMVVAPRVFYAQAAVARLAELLTEEEPA
jgi:hypothetical protein